MASDPQNSPEELMALLASVYGPSEADARDEVVLAAVKKLEATHRQASLAMRNFEHLGVTQVTSKQGTPKAEPRRKARGTQPPQVARPDVKAAPPPTAPPRAPLSAFVETPGANPGAEAPRPRVSIPQRRQVSSRRGPTMVLESGVGREVTFKKP